MEEPQALEDLAATLWALLVCHCENCDNVVDLPPWDDPPWNGDVYEWAAHMAPGLKALGWTTGKEWSLLCPACSEKLS
jgi:hypothetical protein